MYYFLLIQYIDDNQEILLWLSGNYRYLQHKIEMNTKKKNIRERIKNIIFEKVKEFLLFFFVESDVIFFFLHVFFFYMF
jgi:ubiquinone/menaquinone biosynthesis C-methylase UbiE